MQCDEELRRAISHRLDTFERQRAEGPVGANYRKAGLRTAAVAITVTDVGHGPDLAGFSNYDSWQSTAALLLTRRAQTLRNHPGQWAFPGGRLDAGESEEETALREMHEEVDVALQQHRVLGHLDDFVTRSGFVITPIVIWGGPGLRARPNPGEVDSIHRIPLTEFLREDAPMLESMPDSHHPVLRMPVGEDFIAAPTAAMIFQFREVCLLGRHTRVAHYEQPRFAWS